jgi:hypothetical protein
MSTAHGSSRGYNSNLKREFLTNIKNENGCSFNLLDHEDSLNFDIFDRDTDKTSTNAGKENYYESFE